MELVLPGVAIGLLCAGLAAVLWLSYAQQPSVPRLPAASGRGTASPVATRALERLGFVRDSGGTWLRDGWTAVPAGDHLQFRHPVACKSARGLGPDVGGDAPEGWIEVGLPDTGAVVWVQDPYDLARLTDAVLDALRELVRCTSGVHLGDGRIDVTLPAAPLPTLFFMRPAGTVIEALERQVGHAELVATARSRGAIALLAARELLELDPHHGRLLLEHPDPSVRLLAATVVGAWGEVLALHADRDLDPAVAAWAIERLCALLERGEHPAESIVELPATGIAPPIRASAVLGAGDLEGLPALWELVDTPAVWGRVFEALRAAGRLEPALLRLLAEEPAGLVPALERGEDRELAGVLAGLLQAHALDAAATRMAVRVLGLCGSGSHVPALRRVPETPEVRAAIAAIQERAGGAEGAVSVADLSGGALSEASDEGGGLSEAE